MRDKYFSLIVSKVVQKSMRFGTSSDDKLDRFIRETPIFDRLPIIKVAKDHKESYLGYLNLWLENIPVAYLNYVSENNNIGK